MRRLMHCRHCPPNVSGGQFCIVCVWLSLKLKAQLICTVPSPTELCEFDSLLLQFWCRSIECCTSVRCSIGRIFVDVRVRGALSRKPTLMHTVPTRSVVCEFDSLMLQFWLSCVD